MLHNPQANDEDQVYYADDDDCADLDDFDNDFAFDHDDYLMMFCRE